MAVEELSQVKNGDIAVGSGPLAGFHAPALEGANGEPRPASGGPAASLHAPEAPEPNEADHARPPAATDAKPDAAPPEAPDEMPAATDEPAFW